MKTEVKNEILYWVNKAEEDGYLTYDAILAYIARETSIKRGINFYPAMVIDVVKEHLVNLDLASCH